MFEQKDITSFQNELTEIQARLDAYEHANAEVLRLRKELRKAEARRQEILGEGVTRKRQLEETMLQKSKILTAMTVNKGIANVRRK